MRLLAIKFAEDEILFHILIGAKVKTISLNQRNETTVLAEGSIREFNDPEHLITTLSLFSPDTLFFRPPIRMEECIYDELLRIHPKDNAYKGA